MSGPNNDWLHFYNQNIQTQGLTQSIPTSSTIAAPTSPPLRTMMMTSSPSSSSQQHLSPDQGRVSKPTRRRSRASRRTPTTLLNTDTTNFRAMVQQFTGGPSGPFAPTILSSSSSGLPNLLGFGGFESSRASVNNPSGYNILHQQQQQHHFQPQNQLPNINYDGGDNMFGHGGGGGGGRFFPSTSS